MAASDMTTVDRFPVAELSSGSLRSARSRIFVNVAPIDSLPLEMRDLTGDFNSTTVDRSGMLAFGVSVSKFRLA
jgi:hypothetical protein